MSERGAAGPCGAGPAAGTAPPREGQHPGEPDRARLRRRSHPPEALIRDGPPAEVLLGLGGNLGNVAASLAAALGALEAGGVALTAVSRTYRTPPWGVADQPPFLNLCARGTTHLAPRALLALAKSVEAALGRVPGPRWGPRAIDVDLLAYADLTLDEPGLALPHPGLPARAFVLVPLAEIAPDRPVGGRTVRAMLDALPAVEREAVRVDA